MFNNNNNNNNVNIQLDLASSLAGIVQISKYKRAPVLAYLYFELFERYLEQV